MAKDPIIDEIRRHRQEIAARCGYDLRAIIADARKRQKTRGKKVVSLARTSKRHERSDGLSRFAEDRWGRKKAKGGSRVTAVARVCPSPPPSRVPSTTNPRARSSYSRVRHPDR
jgi:hypothetical protein